VSLEKIWQHSDATQVCSRSLTNVWNYDNIGRNCAKISANCRDDYFVTHGRGWLLSK